MRLPREVATVWLLSAAWLVTVAVTYSRLPAHELYHVSGSGIEGGLSRALVELNFPLALVALAVLVAIADRLPPAARAPAVAAAICCAIVAVPGVVRQANLDARWINVVPAAGVVLAFACSLAARRKPRPGGVRGDRLRVAIMAVLTLLAAPWIAAALGFFLDGVPVLGLLFETGRIVSFHEAPHHAVHHGVHHGLEGTILVCTALLLSRLTTGPGSGARARAFFLALLLAYGAGNIANDAWLEQVAERGWTGYALPSVLEPALNWLWFGVLALAAAVWLAWFGRRGRETPAAPPLLTPP